METFTDQLRRIDDADLDPYQFRLLTHYWRVGHCWESLRTTADKCGMSLGQVSKTRQWLLDNGWIEWVTVKGKPAIALCSPHEQTQQLERSPDEQCSPHEQTAVANVHHMNAILNEPSKTDTNVSVADGAAIEQPPLLTIPKETAVKGKRPKRATNPEETAKTAELLTLYGEVLDYPIANYGQEGAAAKRILKHYTAEDAIGCYRWLKVKPFWHDQHLSLASVNKQLGEWVKMGRPSPNGANGNGPATKSDVLAYLNGDKPFRELVPLAQQFVKLQGESNVKKQPAGVVQKQIDSFLAARH